MKCPDCRKALAIDALQCRCGWKSEASKAVQAIAPVGPLCVACRGQLRGGYTAMHCGQACRNCWNAYMIGRWDGSGYSEQRETARLESRKIAA